MKNFTKAASAFLVATVILSTGCLKNNERKQLTDFDQVNLVDNNGKYHATRTDASLINAWGLAWSPNGIAWVNSQGGHVSEVWDNLGNILRPAVNIPSPGGPTGGSPTGIVFNNTPDFVLPNGAAAAFIFVGLDGMLSAWNGGSGANAFPIMNNTAAAVYTGLALASNGGLNYIYAANFLTGRIDVWDGNFARFAMPFTDPNLPNGYSPYNIQTVGSWLVVTYAKVGPDGRPDKGIGNGLVDIFNPDGSFVRRFASRGPLNAPWGVTLAPASFFDKNNGDKNDNKGKGKGKKEDDKKDKHKGNNQGDPVILIGNFGDGLINVYGLDGQFLGVLNAHNRPIMIDGLWALSFAPASATAVDPDRLYFTAGPNNEQDGLFGYLIMK